MNAEEEVATETIIVSENIDSSPEMVPEISRSPVGKYGCGNAKPGAH